MDRTYVCDGLGPNTSRAKYTHHKSIWFTFDRVCECVCVCRLPVSTRSLSYEKKPEEKKEVPKRIHLNRSEQLVQRMACVRVCVAPFNCSAIIRSVDGQCICVPTIATLRTRVYWCVIDACASLNVIYDLTAARSSYSSGSTLCENVRVRVYSTAHFHTHSSHFREFHFYWSVVSSRSSAHSINHKFESRAHTNEYSTVGAYRFCSVEPF